METTHPFEYLTRPRSELPRVVEQRSPAWPLVFAAVLGSESELADLSRYPSPERALRPAFEVIALHTLLGCLRGIIVLALLAVLVATATRLMKHPIDNRQARAILGWSAAPLVLPLALLLGIFAVRGSELLGIGSDGLKAAAPALWWGLTLLQIASGIWSPILAVGGIAGLSKMSIVRSLAAYLLAVITLLAGINLVMFALQWLLPAPLEALRAFYMSH
jgi:hypothetical protein